MSSEANTDFNLAFIDRYLKRHPHARERYERDVAAAMVVPETRDTSTTTGVSPIDAVIETIVKRERPVLFLRKDWVDTENVSAFGNEAEELIAKLSGSRAILEPIMPLVGRIDVQGYPGNVDYIGTGWFVADNVIVTNRHVASLIAKNTGQKWTFSRGMGGKDVSADLNTLHEFDDLAVDQTRTFKIDEILYIEPNGSANDIAFLRVIRKTDGSKPRYVEIAAENPAENEPVVTVGYPAKASRSTIPDQALMQELFRGRYNVKRAAPGLVIKSRDQIATQHDCLTLGGSSGSVILNLAKGHAVGLHYAGLYKQTNYGVSATELQNYVNNQAWRRPIVSETQKAPMTKQLSPTSSSPLRSSTSEVTVTIPLTIKVSLGEPISSPMQVSLSGDVKESAVSVEEAAKQFWDTRPTDVVAVRVGFTDETETIGDKPCIAASVPASRLRQTVAAGPQQFLGFSVRYDAANVAEQIDAIPQLESVDSISYDDDARKGKPFSFAQVNEKMTLQLCVGPEYSWDVLNEFLSGAKNELVSAMYEFHAPQIKEVLEQRLNAGVNLTLVLDNLTFSDVKKPEEEFDRIPTFEDWSERFSDLFKRVVAPEGRAGLISDAYHIKVTVRDEQMFWLSSGNWKKGSSQPVITQQERDDAEDVDLPGNREWHVVVSNQTLADRFRNHILQDYKFSVSHGAGPLPKSKETPDVLLDVPLEEGIQLERRPPSRILEPLKISRKVKIKPLLTPDRSGAVYGDAVLDLIRSARKSLLFQIPYIGTPSNPRDDRGYIDELIKALTLKLKSLDDARLILRVGGSRYSDPTHAAWYFKSKGVDIKDRLRRIDNHHTKGMIIDGQRVLIGSHNWSKPGVTLNRDASLIFDDTEVANYYTDAFEIDWLRSNAIKPKRFVKPEAIAIENITVGSIPTFHRLNLRDLPPEE